MYAGKLRPLPATPEDSPNHLDDEDDYDDGGVVTISLPPKEMENKEAPFISKPAKENDCRKVHVPILYVLVAISFAMWITLFFLVLEKNSVISEALQKLNLNYSEEFMKNSAALEELRNQNLNYSQRFMNEIKVLDYVKTTLMVAERYTSNKFTETEDILESFCSKGSVPLHSCPHSWKSQGRYCYYFSTEKTTWNNALWNCINYKAHLASIFSDEEQVFLRNNLNNVDNYWLGINDLEGQWKWKEGGMLLTTTFWNLGQPSKDVNKDCGIMHPNGTWASAVCSLHNQWICKKKLIC
ncbi:C-type lectin domain family 4 member E-like isoform 2-T4 [Liasis olivaceus]